MTHAFLMITATGTSLVLLGFGMYLLYYAVVNSSGTSFNEFQQLFSQQRLVHVSTIDLTILSLAVRVDLQLQNMMMYQC